MAKKKYPKIAAKAKVKSITTEEKGLKVKFDTLQFSHGQYEQLSNWQGDKDELLITVEQFQSKMDKDKPETDEIPFKEDKKKD